MGVLDQKEKNQNRVTKTNKGMQLPGNSSLASIESLAIPIVQEVVFLADFRCSKCQQRVAEVMAKMNGKGGTDSVVVSVLEKKVTLTSRYPSPSPAATAPPTFWISCAPLMRLFLSLCCR